MARTRNTDVPLEGLHCTPRDSVDALLASWQERRPDLDFGPVAVVARLARVRGHIDAELDRVFRAHGLTAPSFGGLVTLGRVDDGGGVSQRRLMEQLDLLHRAIDPRMDGGGSEASNDRRPDPA